MKMLIVIYAGPAPERVVAFLDAHEVTGYSELRNVLGAGVTGRREGTRAWPGDATLFMSAVPDERAGALVDALRAESGALAGGERLHVAVLPMETFF